MSYEYLADAWRPEDELIAEELEQLGPPQVSARLKERFRELGVAYIGGADDMTDEELNLAAAKLHEWRDKRLVEGAPLYPPNVCVKCLHPHLPMEHAAECRP